MLTRIQLTSEEQEALTALARHTGKSEDELLRDAVGRFLRQTQPLARLAAVRRMDRSHSMKAEVR